MKILVTGSAGFVGSALSLRLLERGDEVVGIDNLGDYYDASLKRARLARHLDHPRYRHVNADLADRAAIEAVFAEHRPRRVVSLAAQAFGINGVNVQAGGRIDLTSNNDAGGGVYCDGGAPDLQTVDYFRLVY